MYRKPDSRSSCAVRKVADFTGQLPRLGVHEIHRQVRDGSAIVSGTLGKWQELLKVPFYRSRNCHARNNSTGNVHVLAHRKRGKVLERHEASPLRSFEPRTNEHRVTKLQPKHAQTCRPARQRDVSVAAG
jgi:hypothetical protein